jgi:hypothetical protein
VDVCSLFAGKLQGEGEASDGREECQPCRSHVPPFSFFFERALWCGGEVRFLSCLESVPRMCELYVSPLLGARVFVVRIIDCMGNGSCAAIATKVER